MTPSDFDEVALTFKYSPPDEAERPRAAEQARYVLASLAVEKLLRAAGQREAADQFHSLAEALLDVVEGLPHPLFAVEHPSKKGGRRNDSAAVWRTKSTLCAGLQFLMAGGGLDRDAAIKFAVRKYPKQLSKLLRPGTDLKTSVGGWMHKFASDEVSNGVALSTYKERMRELATAKTDFSGARIKLAGEDLIRGAAERAARLP